jgi:hypothetical protein
MPKIRCSGCETVLNAPDKAQGKVIACPKCGTKLKVPGGTKEPAKAKAGMDSTADFDKLDLGGLEDHESGAICPYCAAELNPEDPVCRKCGMNVQTGVMDAREQRRRTMKGPDPTLFYSRVFKESWAFLMENKGLAVRTGILWTFFATMNATCAYLAFVFCKTWPTKLFWGGLTVISAFGITGWFLSLSQKVIAASIVKEQFRADRVGFDFFQTVAAGGRTVFWPIVVLGPIVPFVFVILGLFTALGADFVFNIKFQMGLAGILLVLPVLVLPIALVHMTTRYPYKAWILWELLALFAKNAGPTLYALLISFAVFLPVILLAGLETYLIGAGNPFLSDLISGGKLTEAGAAAAGAAPGIAAPAAASYTLGLTGKITLWLMGLIGLGSDPTSAYYYIFKGPLNILASAILLAPIAFLAGFPAIFVMRAIGQFGLYRTQSLDLVQRIVPGTPATFWVRYLAHTVDLLFIPMAGFLVTANSTTLMAQWAMNAFLLLVFFFSPALLPMFIVLWLLYSSWNYWAVQESSELKATLGKDTFGLMIVTEEDKTVSIKQAGLKWFLRVLWYFSFGIPFMIMALDPEKRTLHDRVTRTKVVWKGDK